MRRARAFDEWRAAMRPPAASTMERVMASPRPRWLSGQPLCSLAAGSRGVPGVKILSRAASGNARPVVLDGERQACRRALPPAALAQADVDAPAPRHRFGGVLHQVHQHPGQVFAREPHRLRAAFGTPRSGRWTGRPARRADCGWPAVRRPGSRSARRAADPSAAFRDRCPSPRTPAEVRGTVRCAGIGSRGVRV